jgi:hypothetical protein
MIKFKELFQKKLNEKNGDEETDPLHSSLSRHYKFNDKNHKDNIYKYTTDSYAVNNHLWKKNKNLEETDDEKENFNHPLTPKINHLDSALNKHKTPHSLTVYSGTRHDPNKLKDENGIVDHPSYLSTSLSLGMGKSFAEVQKGNIRHVMCINVPKDHPGAYVANISDKPEEREFILPRGTRLKHEGTDVHSEKHKIYGNLKVHYHRMSIV